MLGLSACGAILWWICSWNITLSGFSTRKLLFCSMLKRDCLCLLREKKSVVVAIRGTQSIADLVTDAVVHPEPMESWVPEVPLPTLP